MVQTVCTISVLAGEKKIILKKPSRLHRIFFVVRTIADQAPVCTTWLSFDDPLFHTYFTFSGPMKYFVAEGQDINQGDVWLYNASGGNLTYTATEILH